MRPATAIIQPARPSSHAVQRVGAAARADQRVTVVRGPGLLVRLARAKGSRATPGLAHVLTWAGVIGYAAKGFIS